MDKELIPYYVGVSRSGCHWLRINLEGYMDGKSPLSNHLGCIDEPIQSMYKRVEAGEFKGTHDMDLDFQTDCVVYLYRNPIDCIFSNLKYDGVADIACAPREAVDHYLDIWIKHIDKWVFTEKFTKAKVILSYDELAYDFYSEFTKLLNFLSIPVYLGKMIECREKYTKEKIREIVHDKKVINVESNYAEQRSEFIKMYAEYIYNRLPESHKNICKFSEEHLAWKKKK